MKLYHMGAILISLNDPCNDLFASGWYSFVYPSDPPALYLCVLATYMIISTFYRKYPLALLCLWLSLQGKGKIQ